MTEKPIRVQRRRTKGWKMPPNTIYVGRGSKWGNPFRISDCRRAGFTGTDAEIARWCVDAFENWLEDPLYWDEWVGIYSTEWRDVILNSIDDLRGKNLACWCGLCDKHAAGKPWDVECPDCAPCHADVLLEIANAP